MKIVGAKFHCSNNIRTITRHFQIRFKQTLFRNIRFLFTAFGLIRENCYDFPRRTRHNTKEGEEKRQASAMMLNRLIHLIWFTFSPPYRHVTLKQTDEVLLPIVCLPSSTLKETGKKRNDLNKHEKKTQFAPDDGRILIFSIFFVNVSTNR